MLLLLLCTPLLFAKGGDLWRGWSVGYQVVVVDDVEEAFGFFCFVRLHVTDTFSELKKKDLLFSKLVHA